MANLSLLTDFYELTMMQGYFVECPSEQAVFEMFFRQQPFSGGYTVFAGLQPLLQEIENMEFSTDSLEYLHRQKIFRADFLEFLEGFRFSGTIYSMEEGTVVFPNEPIMRVHGTLMETQLLESILLNFINFQSLIATKTCRITMAARNSPVLEFGLRRAQGTNGALSATRAAFIGGASSTSNTLGGRMYDIPVSGTMAHSWVMSFPSEFQAFKSYAKLYPERTILLVDTFDTLRSGLPNAISVFRKMKDENHGMMGIRIDSGDLEYLSKKAREMLDHNGLPEVKIFVSSDLDEWIINQLITSGAPIDAWGVGTRLVTGDPQPALSGVYKIVASGSGSDLTPRIKISNQTEKITNPGIKNVMRFYDDRGQMLADLLYLEEEREELMERIALHSPIHFNHPSTDYASMILKNYASTRILLAPVMEKGGIIAPGPALDEIRRHCKEEMESLDETYRRLLNPHTYKVSLSDPLKIMKTELLHKMRMNNNS